MDWPCYTVFRFQEAIEEDGDEKKDLVPSLMIQEDICRIHNDEVNKTHFSFISALFFFAKLSGLKGPPSLSHRTFPIKHM